MNKKIYVFTSRAAAWSGGAVVALLLLRYLNSSKLISVSFLLILSLCLEMLLHDTNTNYLTMPLLGCVGTFENFDQIGIY